ncbi:hypothetical protein [Rheinheimera sp. 4Y26]|uniref:hypothetical protein n=1 Tax=Rheinheimera sp. 4Y26 TaxID=2977811 RepID=UPI0021B0C266|nr:hypothetical protein [Rheinheimera sp. 4Y26]MCT6698369.1 hypothetical protein [Rheinheimera sp. 4Y26]
MDSGTKGKTEKKRSSFFDSDNALLFCALFIIGFLLIAVYQYFQPETNVSHEWYFKYLLIFLKEAGIALMIASVLAFTVESINKKKQIEEIRVFNSEVSRNVLEAVYRTIVPESIFEEIKRSTLEQCLLKKKSKLEYHLSHTKECITLIPPDLKGNVLQCEVTTSYVLENISENDKQHTVIYELSCDLDSRLAAHMVMNQVIIGDKSLSKDEIKALIHQNPATNGIRFEYPCLVKANSSIEVFFAGTTYKRLEDTEVWTTVLPTESMELELFFPQDIDVYADSNHSKELKEEFRNQKVYNKTFRLDYGIFPYQGISFWWRKSVRAHHEDAKK